MHRDSLKRADKDAASVLNASFRLRGNYDPATDRDLFARMAVNFTANVPRELWGGALAEMFDAAGGDADRMAREADEEGFHELAEQFRGVAAIERSHEERYRKLLHNVEAKEVFEKSGVKLWECRNCGHLVMGTKAPDVCPDCKHPQAFFEVRAENY